ncbi:MAG: type II toxin-antitoxin system HicA family toxin [Bacteroidota bacterium]
MTPKLPSITAREIIGILEKRGYSKARQSGSHLIMKHPTRKRVTVPVHAKKDLTPGVLRSIMRDAELFLEDIIMR